MYVTFDVDGNAAPVPETVHVTGTPARKLPDASLTVAAKPYVRPSAPASTPSA